MIQTIKAFETNKNAVLTHYSCPCPSKGERPIGNVVRFLGWFISASVFNHCFSVYKSCFDKIRNFNSLKDARSYIISKYDNCFDFYDESLEDVVNINSI